MITKSKSAQDREVKVGDKIYWSGDAANVAHKYVVLAVDRAHDRLHVEENGQKTWVTPIALVYSANWGWQDEWRAQCDEAMARLKQTVKNRERDKSIDLEVAHMAEVLASVAQMLRGGKSIVPGSELAIEILRISPA